MVRPGSHAYSCDWGGQAPELQLPLNNAGIRGTDHPLPPNIQKTHLYIWTAPKLHSYSLHVAHGRSLLRLTQISVQVTLPEGRQTGEGLGPSMETIKSGEETYLPRSQILLLFPPSSHTNFRWFPPGHGGGWAYLSILYSLPARCLPG